MTQPAATQSDNAPRPPPQGRWDIDGYPPVDLTYAQAEQVVSLIHTRGLGGENPTIGGYQLIDTIGEGGSAVAYRAIRVAGGSEHPVFLKVFHPGGPSRNAQLLRELAALQSLRLDAVPRLIDVGSERGAVYIATELIDGPPLHAWLAEHQPSLTQRVELLVRICRAVQQLHEHGVIHRDIKPANILVTNGTQGPRPFLVDLGIAHIFSNTDTPPPNTADAITVAGAPLGSPGWCAPEQARGQHADVSTRSDVFALGAIGQWAVTGREPRDTGTSIALAIAAAAATPLLSTKDRDQSIPSPLAAVIDKATAFNPAGRYASAADFADDLDRWLCAEPVLATPPSMWQLIGRWITRHPAKSAVLATLIVCAAVVAGTLAAVQYLNRRPSYVYRIGNRAELRSTNGHVFNTIDAEGDPLVIAELLQRPRSLGGGRVYVWACRGHQYSEARGAAVAIRDGDNPDKTLWTLRDAPPLVIPTGVEQVPSPTFIVQSAMLADAIPEPNGDAAAQEIVVVMREVNNGPCCVRVFDLSGKLRFEAWHDGWITAQYWIPQASTNSNGKTTGRLVCLAACNAYKLRSCTELPAPFWKAAFKEREVSVNYWPTALFALDIVPGVTRSVVTPPPRPTNTGEPAADQPPAQTARAPAPPPAPCPWYAWLTPLDVVGTCRSVILVKPKEQDWQNTAVRVQFQLSATPPDSDIGSFITVNGEGRSLKHTVNDFWPKLPGGDIGVWAERR